MQLTVGQLLLTYVLGILTLPVLVFTGLFVLWALLPPVENPAAHSHADSNIENKPEDTAFLLEMHQQIQRKPSTATDNTPAPPNNLKGAHSPVWSPYGSRRTGWLRITRSLGTNPPELTAETNTNITDMVARGFAKWITSKRTDNLGPESATNMMVAEGAQDLYYVVLDGDTLVMYDGEPMHECRGVIIMTKYRVSLHHRPNTSEAQVYSRKTPIRLAPLDDSVEAQMYKRQVAEYYIYVDRPSEKEDWYFALTWSSLLGLAAESNNGGSSCSEEEAGAAGEALYSEGGGAGSPPNSPQPATHASKKARTEREPTSEQRDRLQRRLRQSCLMPDRAGIGSIMHTIGARGSSAKPGDVQPDEWLNGIFGRMFLAAYRTEWARQHFIRKMQTKFDRVEKPIFLDRIVVADLDIGDNVPVITNFKLESFGSDGQVDASMFVHYMGGFKLVLHTGVKIGSLRMSVSLSVVLQSVAGKMLLRFKPAPSNRFWMGFYEMPSLRLHVSPVFMQKQVKYAAVSQAIEKQIYDIVRTTLVLPNLDDTVFFPTTVEEGAILESSLKEFHNAGLDKHRQASGDPEQASDDSAAAMAAEDSPHLGSDQMRARQRKAQDQSRPLSVTSAEPSATETRGAPPKISVNSPHQRYNSVDVMHTHSSPHLLVGNAMVTPHSLPDDLLVQQPGMNSGRATPTNLAQAPSGRSPSPASRSVVSQKRAMSIKNTISDSAASLFKRARDSQAAGSAKTWWQNIQQSANNGNNSNSSTSTSSTLMAENMAATAATKPMLDPRPIDSDTGLGIIDISTNRSTSSLPTAATISADIAPTSPSAVKLSSNNVHLMSQSHVFDGMTPRSPGLASEDVEDGVRSVASGFQFPRMGENASNGRNPGTANRDSLLVRRRPAALSQGSEIELPAQRHYSKPAPAAVTRPN
ncbi:hypothetical protein BX661DRAFT_175913 [Kickxella alabastrina]|uniref:uncharacterized protein n=1 Tax=Kickxella alabastrina TaxID=61397 RepID=UPI00221F705A|nr:uncharacterized protein BX661DRAFT_175913 [Kickxella alabastrina]KAI7834995.1 hypothetical protein BX661DRAFT_175913 [Kickxella alabastrina]KAJ1947627.1 hypothetical protein GGF37_000210 [Kickxella alabastrina]